MVVIERSHLEHCEFQLKVQFIRNAIKSYLQEAANYESGINLYDLEIFAHHRALWDSHHLFKVLMALHFVMKCHKW
ncbi:hypothetical protein [Scytonema sp. NUACC21]